MATRISAQGLANKKRKIMRDVDKINEVRAQVRKMESTENYTYFHFDEHRAVTFKLCQMELKLKSYILDYLKMYKVSEEYSNSWKNYSLAQVLGLFNIYSKFNLFLD